jgi:hypothetical protein|tara:strand:+ start:26 stop:478 length:453 start_codon:yes stop_codon:yes gene_type:complete
MAYFKPRRNRQGSTYERRLPGAPEGSSIGGASLYDAFIESLWKRNLDEYRRKEIGFGDRQLGKEPMDYPGKEEWWDDPRSRLDLSREYHKYYSEERLERERLLKEEIDVMEKSFFELLLNRPTPKKQWLWDAKRKAKREEKDRTGGEGIV